MNLTLKNKIEELANEKKPFYVSIASQYSARIGNFQVMYTGTSTCFKSVDEEVLTIINGSSIWMINLDHIVTLDYAV